MDCSRANLTIHSSRHRFAARLNSGVSCAPNIPELREERILNKFDALILFGSGYTCGCACMAGPAMHSFKDKFSIIKKWPFLWGVVAGVNGVLVGIIAVLMFSLFAIGKNPGFPDFWPRALLFTVGLIAGGSLVFSYMRKIEALIKK